MKKGKKLYEGKAKIIYATNDKNLVIQYFKDDATAFNNQKKTTIEGKGVLNNRISEHILSNLSQIGIKNHLVKRLNMREQVIKLVEIIPLEFIVRNVATGSITKRLGIEDGTVLKKPLIEYCLKDDKLGDPLISEDHILTFDWASKIEIDKIKKMILRINDFMIGIYGTGLLFLCFNMLLILSCSLFVCIEKIKQKPYNYIYASSFTIFMSYFLFYMCYSIQPRILLESGLSTLFMFSGLSIYSWQSTIDYSTKGNYLLLSLLTLLLLGVFNIFFNYTFIETIYPVLGVFLFSFYIIYDTQLIFGRQTIKYKPEDYLIASINLYLDIINLFIYLLELINGR